MSYILDALQRAESERARGRLPDIHDPSGPASRTQPSPRPHARPLVWVAVGLAGGLIVAAAMHLGVDRLATDPAGAAAVPVAAAPTAGAAPVVQTPPTRDVAPPVAALPPLSAPHAQTTATPTEPPAAVPPPTSPPVVSTPFLPPPVGRPSPRERPSDAAPEPPQVAQPTQRPVPGSTGPAGRPAASAPASPPPVLAYRDLPESVRRQLPAFKLGGSIYSERRTDRLLIVDGQLAREGDEVAPGLVLEQIGLRTAVFRHGTLRFDLPL